MNGFPIFHPLMNVREKGCQPKKSAKMLIHDARFSVKMMIWPPGLRHLKHSSRYSLVLCICSMFWLDKMKSK